MSQIGVDQWVEQSDERRQDYQGWTAPARRLFDKLAPGGRLALFLLVAAAYPFFVRGSDVRVGITILLLAMVALGLNVVVGWAGLLDLGYVAFYGFGAYFYAIVASNQLPAHWPTWIAIPVIVAASALLGALLSLPSRRLVGDYLAIMTLFFAQVFVELVRNFERLPFVSDDLNLTGGPNGIPGVFPWELFGFSFNTFHRNYYLALAFVGLLIIGLHNLNDSRTGRAWRALREDTLAAEHMTTPVNRLKMLAFAVGAGIAGLTGTLFAAVQVGVFPNNFNLFFLITMYAAVILGGSGSIPGVVLGAIAIAYTPELLRDPGKAGWLFYIGLVVLLVVVVRRWERIAATVGGVIVFGFIVRVVASGIWDEATMGEANDTFISRLIDDWVLVLGAQSDVITNYAFVLAVVGMLTVVVASGWWKIAALIPTIYLAVLVWENKLAFQPSITRQLLFGGVLVVMMAVRPQGLLGTKRVEII
ncbi:MAG: branched-chain amino acid ABC transporter permease [Acidimicrobiia bacterium]|nr:branched-chain amino acid ABC transporter permease [Acidimicrobiia bacterium]NNF10306.1 branched-chain amino acid ABC transporter permease [Acidimicrobiia bacterium]NNL71093.1 branched-chain amino acid ABC transporter permease [Acidimicrobiia bacterium]